MADLIMLKCGELVLKGNNRKSFEDKLRNNLKWTLKKHGKFHIWISQSTIYVTPEDDEADMEGALEATKKVFGVATISPAFKAEKNFESICEVAKKKLKNVLENAQTFKVEAKRADKKFPMKSPEICMELGGVILEAFPNLKVNVIKPQVTVTVDVREEYAYIYCEKMQGAGGVPSGTSGKGLLLLSGGIDSPVAGWMMARRGLKLEAINFFSYPYTSDRAKEKVIELARIVSQYSGRIKLHVVPFTDIQLAIRDNCPEDQLTIIMRRIMTRISEIIAKQCDASVLITGESVGQVASQTLQSMVVTSSVTDMLILRPLAGMDKIEIMDYARKIGTYETSILPYEDCCTLFVPKHPDTNPKMERIEASEARLDMEKLIAEAVAGTQIIEIK
ncbi:MAG: tRNA 4-thiouridine(8) synthase ThiI [Clostridia bacterium]|nr:tRNA 4-thiouridine(8) synthase ThiI [Clostridia bacterium]